MKTNNNYVTRKTVRKGKVFLAVMALLLVCALFFSGCGSKASAGIKEVNAETIKANVIEPPKGNEKQAPVVQKAHVNQQQKVCDNPYCDDWDCDDIVCDDNIHDYYEDQYEDRYDLDDRYDRDVRTCTNPNCYDNDCDDLVCYEDDRYDKDVRTCTNPNCYDNDCDDLVCYEDDRYDRYD